jgi:hypothetical protein
VDEFFELSMKSEQDYEYIVAWNDRLSKRKLVGRGLFMRGNHCSPQLKKTPTITQRRNIKIPLDLPGFVLNNLSIKAFNFFYFHKQWSKCTEKTVYYEPFFYPLDSISDWNRLYGKRGFMQYQCVVPDRNAIKTMLSEISQSGMGSFLSVLKMFGDIKSPGMLSFPRKGVTLALDYPNKGQRTLELLERLDQIVRNFRGSVYPAKDSRMSSESFKSYYPQWVEFAKFVDPKFSSSFWRRVTK